MATTFGVRTGVMVRVLATLAVTTALLASPNPTRAGGGRCYVDASAAGVPDGLSWATAYTDLQDALADATCWDMWVANGVYTPGAAAGDTFSITEGEKVYGGFAGGEVSLDARNALVNVTILSGDIAGDDVNLDGNNIDESSGQIVGTNSAHVVTMIGTATPITAATVLDSVFITGGDATPGEGGGLQCNGSGAVGQCSPWLNAIVFIGNRATWGGALHNSGAAGGVSSPTVTLSIFSGNLAAYGGAVYNNGFNGTSNPGFAYVSFFDNEASFGGGAVNSRGEGGVSSPSFTYVSFISNLDGVSGGAVYNDGDGGVSSPAFNLVSFVDNEAAQHGGAVFNTAVNGQSSPGFTNVTFQGNGVGGTQGGALKNYATGTGVSSPSLVNVTFSGNTGSSGGAIQNQVFTGGTSAPSLTNVILWGDTGSLGDEVSNTGATPTYSYSVIEGSGGSGGGWDATLGTDLGGNIDADPMLGSLMNNWTMALLSGSSALDTGNLGACPANDQRLITRPRGTGCDIGAYERPTDPADFDGDYDSDVVLYRAGAWLFYDYDTTTPLPGVWTGNPGGACIPAPMDYDGDGNKDFTQLCSGAWNFYNNAGVLVKGIWVGNIAGLKPVPADYDGDNIDDIVVFNAGAWNKYDYVSGALVSGVWTGNPGGNGIPAPMDYDGNGTADPTILSGGAWHFYNDNGPYNKGIWVGNVAGQLPVPGDYYGDGIDDVMVYRAGAWLPYNFITGAFLAAQSVWTGNPAPPAGGGATKPAPIDYDGDGTLDFTVFAGGPWHFYNDNGSYNKGIWVGKSVADKPISRRLLP